MSRLVTLDHGLQSFAVMRVAGGDADEEGQSVRVRQDVHLGTRLAPVHRTRTCVFAPFYSDSGYVVVHETGEAWAPEPMG
ncbi:hypothetical protein GCM10010521_43790 [Streptomyces rameus]|uniref:Uncharacterized protein n=1 Tax=Streptomyces rameus TaxID=68261 RepID=A0ABP6NL06_9ACTN